jgi:hypothetical protein
MIFFELKRQVSKLLVGDINKASSRFPKCMSTVQLCVRNADQSRRQLHAYNKSWMSHWRARMVCSKKHAAEQRRGGVSFASMPHLFLLPAGCITCAPQLNSSSRASAQQQSVSRQRQPHEQHRWRQHRATPTHSE